ncbi:hypothetical protein AM1_D0111 (plasmid) [Acaryochloris marina MBIC11017]|uniref:Uncharacterized protein n=1 Tax=Acaryochloris marina (strain MBIC 11017) TaxID=329726 RepID=A8ZNM0_ACAM1|nr:hypothetical protein AM1_D0111 [Acaryochloris marina MBIC11017]
MLQLKASLLTGNRLFIGLLVRQQKICEHHTDYFAVVVNSDAIVNSNLF